RGASHPIADGKVHRANAQGKKKARNQHVWYVLHLDTPASGAFGDLQTGIQDTWTEKRPSAMTAAERAELKKRMAETQRQREEERAALNAAAAAAAGLIMASTEKAPASHPYLAKKGLPPFPGLRRLKQNVKYTIEPDEDPRTARAGSLVVPLYTPGTELASVQFIGDDGTKRFLKGTAKEGNYHPIGKRPEDPGAEFTIAIAEGYSTAARVHQATGYLTITAFDAGNLGPVSKAIRAKYPKARLLFAADNDRLVKMPDGVSILASQRRRKRRNPWPDSSPIPSLTTPKSSLPTSMTSPAKADSVALRRSSTPCCFATLERIKTTLATG
ncbi:toprim domain-containing protein, partial [Mesorhizobium sp. M2A.F.Ca.ET.029.05.1.1]